MSSIPFESLIRLYGGESDPTNLPTPIRADVMEALEAASRRLRVSCGGRIAFVNSPALVARSYRCGEDTLIVISLGLFARLRAFLHTLLKYDGRRDRRLFHASKPLGTVGRTAEYDPRAMPALLRPILGDYESPDEFWKEAGAAITAIPAVLAEVGVPQMLSVVGHFVLAHERVHLRFHHHCIVTSSTHLRADASQRQSERQYLELIADYRAAEVVASGMADAIRGVPEAAIEQYFANAAYGVSAYLALSDATRALFPHKDPTDVFHAHPVARGALIVEAIEGAIAPAGSRAVSAWISCAEKTWGEFNWNCASLLDALLDCGEITGAEAAQFSGMTGAFLGRDESAMLRDTREDRRRELEGLGLRAMEFHNRYVGGRLKTHVCVR